MYGDSLIPASFLMFHPGGTSSQFTHFTIFRIWKENISLGKISILSTQIHVIDSYNYILFNI